jgi:hypothetical protein
MKFKDIIGGLLAGKKYTYTNKNDDVSFYILFDVPINEDDKCLCLVYFEDLEDKDDDIDPVPFELQPTDLTTNLWREVVAGDYFTEAELEEN